MNVKLNLNNPANPCWPTHVSILSPFVVRGKDALRAEKVCMVIDNEAVFFADGLGGLTFIRNFKGRWVQNNYDFVRYLGKDESITITGN